MSVQVFVLLYSLPLLWVYRSLQNPAATHSWRLQERYWLGLWLLAGLLLRLLPLWDAGFHYDTSTYKAWALKLSDPAAPLAIYEPGYFADYPPLYMYVLAAIGWLARNFGLEGSSHFNALIKLPAVLADLAVAGLLYARFKRSQSPARSLLLASLYWLNPVVIFDSVFWGQTEAVLALLLLLAWGQWQQGRLWAASLALGAAVAFKPQGLFFAYVYGLALLVSQPLGQTLRQALLGFSAFVLIILPFAWNQDADWILRLYFSSAENYNYLSVNAYNLWALFGGNWSRGEGEFLWLNWQIWAMLLGAGSLSLLAIHTGRRLRQGLPQEQAAQLLAWCLALCTILFFMLAPRMHERYVLSLIPMLVLLSAQTIPRYLLLLWTASSLLNMAFVFHHYIGLDQVAPADGFAIRALSAANLLILLLSLWAYLAPEKLARAYERGLGWLRAVPALEQTARDSQVFSWRHALSLLLLGAMALGLSNIELGSKSYPQSGIELANGEIHYHYQQPIAPRHVLIYAGTGKAKISIEQADGDSWSSLLKETELKDFYRVHQLPLSSSVAAQDFRIRISEAENFQLQEMVFLDAGKTALPPDAVRSDSPDAARLFDESESWLADPGPFISTYFDEIYHARTAYEFLQRQPIYEYTHPPLGKWLISIGIERFGMNPFGMRIAGVVATAAIVMALAWGGWLLAGNLRALWFTGLLGLFEFSRFSIGRYSTIDSFLILFLLLSALLLWRSFCHPSLARAQDGWRLSPSLLLAGLFLGAAIAVKWSALYFGMGLFAWFVYSLISAQSDWRQRGHLLLVAGLCFGLLPAVLYYHSYLPYLRCLADAPSLWSVQGLGEILKSQRDMYNYHSSLKDTHSFSSAFYTWPLMLKPLWLVINDHAAPLRSSITLLGNPLIWWTGLAGLLALATRRLQWPAADRAWLLIGVASLYLPWMAISRVSFIYHYYPIVPFLVLLLGVSLARWPLRQGLWRHLPVAFITLAGLLFLWFFPAISGLAVPNSWSASLRWLPGWWML